MADVPPGHRNETLFGIAAELARFGSTGQEAERQLRVAALDSGLHPKEVDRAIEQGFAVGAAHRVPYDIWLARHRGAICNVAPRTRYLVEAALMYMIRTLLVAQRNPNAEGDLVGYFSARTIAEALGVGVGTAQRLLTLLQGIKLIQRVAPGAIKGRVATAYRLVDYDADANWNNQTPALLEYEYERCMYHFHPGLEFPDLLTLPALLEHNLFRNARDGGLSFPKGVAYTLYAIMTQEGEIERADLADVTGFSEATSARHLATLIDFGFLHVNAFGHFKIAVPNVFELLDALEATCIVPDRRAAQAAAFEAERAGLDARQVDPTSKT